MDKTPANPKENSKEKLFPYSRKKVAAGAIAATVAVATIGAAVAQTTPRTVLRPSIEAEKPESLTDRAEKAAQGFAAQILNISTAGEDRQVYRQQNKGGGVTYTVEIGTGALVGSDYGLYSLSFSGEPGADGVLDADEVNSLYIVMDTMTGNMKDTPEGELYSFQMDRAGDNDNGWYVVVDQATKGTERIVGHYTTLDVAGEDGKGNVYAMTPENLEAITGQAQVILDWAKEAAPVNYAPNTN